MTRITLYPTTLVSIEDAIALQNELYDIAEEKSYDVNPGGQLKSEESTATLWTNLAWILKEACGISWEEAIRVAREILISDARDCPSLFKEWRQLGLKAMKMVHKAFRHSVPQSKEDPPTGYAWNRIPVEADWYAWVDAHLGKAPAPQAPQTTAPAKAKPKAKPKAEPQAEPQTTQAPQAQTKAEPPAKAQATKAQATKAQDEDIIENWLKDPQVAQLCAILQGLPSDVLSRSFVTAFFNKKNAKNTPQHYCAEVAKLLAMLRGRFTGEE